MNSVAHFRGMQHNRCMLLVFPPVAKPCEPPAGIARLAGSLRANGIPCRLLDANLEGVLWLISQSRDTADTWSRRAMKNRETHLAALRDPLTYSSPDRYGRAASDLNRLLAISGVSGGVEVGMSDYRDPSLSPVRSRDLFSSAEAPESNRFFPYFSRRLPELLDGVETVGFSVNYLGQALCAFAMIGFVRKRFPRVRIVIGGGLVTSWMRRPGWKSPFGGIVDHMIAGPGELPLLAIHGVAGTCGVPVISDFGDLPLDRYLSPGFVLPYSASRGCYWNRCSFCPERAEGNLYLPLPAGEALAELRELNARYRPALIHLLDNAISPALMAGMVEQSIGTPWYGFVRFTPELEDPDFCFALKRSGCVMLKLGLESGDQQVLDSLHKGISLDSASRILGNLKRAGIAVYLYLLFGTPPETESAARRTLAFVVRHCEAVTFLNLALFNMPAWGEDAAAFGTGPFYEGDLSLYTGFSHPAGWDRKKVRRFLESEFKRTPEVAQILRNDPPQFTSNHAPFFRIRG